MTTFTGYAAIAGIQAEDGLSTTLAALKEALPGFLRLGGPILDKHEGAPVGKVTGAVVDRAGLRITAQIHDPGVLAKIKRHNYLGWSIGFKYSSARDVAAGVLQGFDLTEISVCPLPSCSGCFIEISKP